MDENYSPSAESANDGLDFNSEEVKGLYKELVNETEVLKKILANHLVYLQKPSSKEWLTSTEVLNFLKISKRSLQRYRDSGTLRYKVVLGNYRYMYDDVLKIIHDAK